LAHLILASASPRRRELLALLGLDFTVWPTAVGEEPLTHERPAALALRLALAKARSAFCEACAAMPDRQLVIASDTVVALGDEPLGKPRDAAEAAIMLRRLRGRVHQVHTAVALLGPTGCVSEVALTSVRMRRYSERELAAYVASGDPLDKAGAYAIQHPVFRPVREYWGCYANVMGLPLCHLTRCLRGFGIAPPVDVAAACQAHTGRPCRVHRAILVGQPGISPL